MMVFITLKNESQSSLTINRAVTDVIFTNVDSVSLVLQRVKLFLFDNGTKWEVIGGYSLIMVTQ
jgi:hypothetical protein